MKYIIFALKQSLYWVAFAALIVLLFDFPWTLMLFAAASTFVCAILGIAEGMSNSSQLQEEEKCSQRN